MLHINCKNDNNFVINISSPLNSEEINKVNNNPYSVNLLILDYILKKISPKFTLKDILKLAIQSPIQSPNELLNKEKRNKQATTIVGLIIKYIIDTKNVKKGAFDFFKIYPGLHNIFKDEYASNATNKDLFKQKLKSGVKCVLRAVNNNIGCLSQHYGEKQIEYKKLASRKWHTKIWLHNMGFGKLAYAFPSGIDKEEMYKERAIKPENFEYGVGQFPGSRMPTNRKNGLPIIPKYFRQRL
jgi:hypothetical protein